MFIWASCATPNYSLVNIYIAMVLTYTEKSEAENNITHVNPSVKSMQIFLEPKLQFSGEKLKAVLIIGEVYHATLNVLFVK